MSLPVGLVLLWGKKLLGDGDLPDESTDYLIDSMFSFNLHRHSYYKCDKEDDTTG